MQIISDTWKIKNKSSLYQVEKMKKITRYNLVTYIVHVLICVYRVYNIKSRGQRSLRGHFQKNIKFQMFT